MSLRRLAQEPPFRIFARAALKCGKPSVRTRARWEISRRPAYLVGILAAAEQAQRQNINEISVIEFGVAGGDGLVAMQDEAVSVESETGVKIHVYGFDAGGLPTGTGDYRDHPDLWNPGDFPMDVEKLKTRLTARTTLILGNVRETVAQFFRDYQPAPIGFIAFDLDLYSSTRDALEIFREDSLLLWHVALYFDDIEPFRSHRYAGELLAIDEFNIASKRVKIDRWYCVKHDKPFPERAFWDKMFVAHDLAAKMRSRRKIRAALSLKE